MPKSQFEEFKEMIEKAGTVLNLESWIIEELKKPDQEISRTYAVKLVDGRKIEVPVCCVLYNRKRGVYKGGITRENGKEQLDLEKVRARAGWMMMKTAIVDIDFGGAKTAFGVDPADYADGRNAERIIKELVFALQDVIGPTKYVPAPDRGTGAREMGWIFDAYDQLFPDARGWGATTGKPLSLHGSPGREVATAEGGLYVLKEALEKSTEFKIPLLTIRGLRIVIQGFGNVGYNFADLISKEGARIIAVSDSKGGVFNPAGLDIARLRQHKDFTGSVLDFPDGFNITNEELLALECDVLVPAARENIINLDNVDNIKTKIMLELANGPLGPGVDPILEAKGIIILADILANTGGVTGSKYEWVQNNAGDQWLYQDIQKKLPYVMRRATFGVLKTAQEYNVSNRFGAYIYALKNLAETMRLRGQYRLSESHRELNPI